MILSQYFSYFLYKSLSCWYSFFELPRLVEVIQIGTNNICVIKKKIHCNLKTTKSIDCTLIRVCAVIGSNTVLSIIRHNPYIIEANMCQSNK